MPSFSPGLFWATRAGAERDLLMIRSVQRVGIEFKRADAPTRTRSMMIAMSDLRLDALYVIYPGPHRHALAPDIEAVPLAMIGEAAAGR